MDLKSMLNESNVQKHAPTPPRPSPVPTLSHSTSQGNGIASSSHRLEPRDRPPQPPPLQAADLRSPGSYFSSQSPYSHPLPSTPGAKPGPHLQSPAAQGHPYSTQSPSSSILSPGQTPGARQQQLWQEYQAHQNTPNAARMSWEEFCRLDVQRQAHTSRQYFDPQRPPSSHSSPPPPPLYNQAYHGRQNSNPSIASPYSQVPPFSPQGQLHSQPGTPVGHVGPPGTYQKSAYVPQRALSHSFDHYRTLSTSSTGSHSSLTQGQRVMASPQQPVRTATIERQYSDERDRERSMSVSPKTIPQSSLPRKVSSENQVPAPTTPASGLQTNPILSDPSLSRPSSERMLDAARESSTPISSSVTPKEVPQVKSDLSPGRALTQVTTPEISTDTISTRPSPSSHKQTGLKRNASVLSGMSASPQPVRKRLRMDEIPIFAQSARKKPVRLTMGTGPAATVKHSVPARHAINGHAEIPTNGNIPRTASVSQTNTPSLEPSITNKIPYEDLTRRVCDWIVNTIGLAEAPSGGAVFEIEAKIGEIHDVEDGQRLNLPVETETIFNREKFRRTRFESSMNMAQHKKLNEFLNSLVPLSLSDPARSPIFYDHRRESDQFFELTPVGIRSLPPSVTQWLNPRHSAPRVRVTTDLETLAPKARIIKSRIADLEIYNPSTDFDFRISISIELPYDGPNEHLTPLTAADQGVQHPGGGGYGPAERNKDRVSYRHQAYQIDLTQVSYSDPARTREHELEVEISTDWLRRELGLLKTGRATDSRYEELVRGFVDNVRVLCRQGSIGLAAAAR